MYNNNNILLNGETTLRQSIFTNLIETITKYALSNSIEDNFTENAIDAEGNPIEGSCVVVTSKVFDDGLYFLSSEKSSYSFQWFDEGIGGVGSAPYGLIIEDMIPGNVKVTDIKGTYKFVKSDYVEEYVFENGIRRIKMKDGRYQEIDFTGCAVDYSNPY